MQYFAHKRASAVLVPLIAATIVLGQFTHLAAAQRSVSYDECLRLAGGDTAAVLACSSNEHDMQSSILAKAYGDLSLKSTPEERVSLTRAQHAWTTYRDAECKFQYLQTGGTMAHIRANDCLVSITKLRIKELQGDLSADFLNGR